MATGKLSGFLRHLRHIVRAPQTAPPSDGQLLEQFAANRDEAAFATLVQRHGPLVLGVCRRLLSNPRDAEDAFQATFVVLARQAKSLRRQSALASWLYRVAYQTAMRARTNSQHVA
ncbi:MAG: sigma-70 family RNA polymerase sigma factor [Gemmataceae bacterium]|nr:sigma-70 family RNA polymerase sigma factor [Gemmataceae bacterium]